MSPWKTKCNAEPLVNNWNRRLAECVNYLRKQSNISLMFLRKLKKSQKVPFFLILASKKCFNTSQRYWAFDEQDCTWPKQHLKTVKQYLEEDKAQLFSDLVIYWHREKFLCPNCNWNLMKKLGEFSCGFHKPVSFHGAKSKSKLLSQKVVLSQFTEEEMVNFSLSLVKFEVIVLASPKTTFWK